MKSLNNNEIPVLGAINSTNKDLIWDGSNWIERTEQNIALIEEYKITSYCRDYSSMSMDINGEY